MRKMILTARAHMPASMPYGRGDYINIALVELDPDWPECPAVSHVGMNGAPTMISERARGIRQIIRYRGPLYEGKMIKSQAAHALTEMKAEL